MAITFTEAGAAKIKKAVNIVLNAPQNRGGERTRDQAPGETMWGLILDRDGTDASGKRFTFVRVFPSFDQLGDFNTPNNIEYMIGDNKADIGWAVEANGNVSVPVYTVVMMKFAGYDASGNPMHLFQYESFNGDIPLPIHDHRDNFNGGFSFAVFSPGTGLPQQPWSR